MSEFWPYDEFEGNQNAQGGGDDFLSNFFTLDPLLDAPSSAMNMPADHTMNPMFMMDKNSEPSRSMDNQLMAGGAMSPGNTGLDSGLGQMGGVDDMRMQTFGQAKKPPGQMSQMGQMQMGQMQMGQVGMGGVGHMGQKMGQNAQNMGGRANQPMNTTQMQMNPQMNSQMNPQMNPQMNQNQMSQGQINQNQLSQSQMQNPIPSQLNPSQMNPSLNQNRLQNSQMNMNAMGGQQSMMNNFSTQMRMPQGQQALLDTSKKEQLSRMRQQIMQQQMLQTQKQKQSMNQGQAPAPNQANQARMKNMDMDAGAQLRNFTPQQYGGPPGKTGVDSPAMASQNRQFANQNTDLFYRQQPQNFSFQLQPPQPAQQAQPAQTPLTPLQPLPMAAQPQAGPTQRKIQPAEMAQLQIELFMAVLSDYMSRRGSPIREPIVVNRKRVNLFFLYALSHKLGGVQVMVKALQQPLQPSPWSVLAQRLNLYEGADSPAKRESIDKELSSCYVQYILPYEQYCNTPDGQKDIQERRLHYQKQLVAKMQRQAKVLNQGQSPQAIGVQPRKSAMLPAQMGQMQMNQGNQGQMGQMQMNAALNLQLLNQPNHAKQIPNQIPTQPPQTQMSPAMSPAFQKPVPQALNQPMPEAASSAPTPRQRQQSRASILSHNSPQVSSPLVQLNPSRAGSVVQPVQRPVLALRSTPSEKPTSTTNMIKNYIPYRASADTQAGPDAATMLALGQEVDLARPVYMFAPELGSINLHALTMSLKSMADPNSDELTMALNTLLVVSLDAALLIKLPDCPELLDALCSVGLQILECIVAENTCLPKKVVTDRPANDIDTVYDKYVGSKTQDEDIAFFVDSLTGQVVDSDMDLDDDLFSPIEESSAELLPEEPPKVSPLSEYRLDDYLAALRGFKEENSHHFSKQQARSGDNEQLMMVDQMVSVLMILRSLTVLDVNKSIAANHPMFKRLVLQTVRSLAEHGGKFLFYRKRLSLLKDCLLMLQNVALEVQLTSMEEAFLAISLACSFGAAASDNYEIPAAPLETYSYLPFAVDLLTKFLVQEPQNRSLMQAVLTGSLLLPTGVNKHDFERTKTAAVRYVGDKARLKSGQLATNVFHMMMSVIPFEKSAPELTKAIFLSAPTVSQALFGAKLVLDLLPMDEEATSDLSTRWLVANKHSILSNLGRSAVAMIGEAAKLPRGSNEHRVVTTIVQQVLIVVNTLLAHALTVRDKLMASGNDRLLVEEINGLADIVRVGPDPLFAMETVLATLVDEALSREVVRLVGALRRLEER